MVRLAELPLAAVRQNFHRYPECGWEEFRTTALIAEELDERGFDLFFGAEAMDPAARLGVPEPDELEAARTRAIDNGAPVEYVDEMGDITGVLAEKSYGSDGPVVGVRVDIDALPQQEAMDDTHRPAKEGFASAYPNAMHACGHDGHAAIGLGLARKVDDDQTFDGTLKLFFQPAEEGGRGGKPMSRSAHLDDVEYFLSLHLGLDNETGTVIAAYENPLPNAKIDVTLTGESSHAGKAPQEGRNAVQALSTAIQNLYSIPRHGDGITRVNVGHIRADNAQNVVADAAEMRVEVRGGGVELNEYMLNSARRVIRHAAAMHEVEPEFERFGETTSFVADDACIENVVTVAKDVPGVDRIIRRRDLGASEDASFLIRRVQENGGKATYVGVGASNPSGHHTSYFDIDEDALPLAVEVLSSAIYSFE
ncbi:amidohydrolase (plasmid) [Haloferacaceae archaeon DSL9]